MSKYDLTRTVVGNLDRHLILPILDYLGEKNSFDRDSVNQSKLQLVRTTKMVDFAEELYKTINDTEDVPEEFKTQREEVLGELQNLKNKTANLCEALADDELVGQLREQKKFNILGLQEALKDRELEVVEEDIESLFEYGKLNYECGYYQDAADFLHFYRELSNDSDRKFDALWGKLASDILTSNWETAIRDWQNLRDEIENRVVHHQVEQTNLNHLQQYTSLIHWGLFVFFNIDNGYQQVTKNLVENEKMLNVIRINCPHIFRYLAVADLMNRKPNAYNDLAQIFDQDKEVYSDPVTQFLVALLIDFDFETARNKLQESVDVLSNDFFLDGAKETFFENCRILIFQTYCRLHKYVDVHTLAHSLRLNKEEAERKIIDYIKQARLDAKIDLENNRLILGTQQPSIHQQVIDKTKDLIARSSKLSDFIDKKLDTLQELD